MLQFGNLTPNQTNYILSEIKHSPNKNLGQNFLIDANIVRKSLELADVNANDNIVEVGPGLGTLTGALIQANAKVWAVELDKHLYTFLTQNFGECENLNLLNADAVDFPVGNLAPDVSDYKVVANLPYAISTPWLDAILSLEKPPKVMSLMLQKEAVLRFSAKVNSKDFTPISIFLNSMYEVVQIHNVSSGCFYPKPKVDSALLSLKLKDTPYVFAKKTKKLIRYIFSKKRKQIKSIAKSSPMPDLLLQWIKICETIDNQDRPATISLDAWQMLNNMINQAQ